MIRYSTRSLLRRVYSHSQITPSVRSGARSPQRQSALRNMAMQASFSFQLDRAGPMPNHSASPCFGVGNSAIFRHWELGSFVICHSISVHPGSSCLTPWADPCDGQLKLSWPRINCGAAQTQNRLTIAATRAVDEGKSRTIVFRSRRRSRLPIRPP